MKVNQAARLNNNLSIYAAEIMAISMALQWILTLTRIPIAVIFSDSLASLKTLKCLNTSTRHNLMHSSIQLLQAVGDRVTLVWTDTRPFTHPWK